MSIAPKPMLAQVWPLILANATVPLLGLTDTAVLGHWGDEQQLAALAVSTLIFNFLYWSLGFLRMSTTGFVAQADGAGDQPQVQAAIVRAGSLALLLGGLLILGQAGLIAAVFKLLQVTETAEAGARAYFALRIWGAPATLMLYVVSGVLIALGRVRALLVLQLGVTGLNAALDYGLVVGFAQGVKGVALGTAISEWVAAITASLWLGRQLLPRGILQFFRNGLFSGDGLRRTFVANGDMFIRTLFLLLGFAWFTNQVAAYGDIALAANHILLGLISFSAFFLDAFAYVAEAQVGRAMGKNSRQGFYDAIGSSSRWAVLSALGLAGLLYSAGSVFIASLTGSPAVASQAQQFLPWACVYVALSVAAFQLDGIFIGATATRAMRNASVGSFAILLLVGHTTKAWQLHGLWLSFVVFVCARALLLLAYFPQLLRRLV